MKTTKKGATIFVALLSILLIPLISAELLISQPNSLYNFGDKFTTTITIKPQSYASGYLTATLSCSAGDVELYKSPHSVEEGGSQDVQISMNLDNFLVSGLEGECSVKAEFADDTATSTKFQLSRLIDVTTTLEGKAFNPGDTVKINGKATKENGQALDGFVEITLKEIDFSHSSSVTDGTFNLNFTIPEKAKSGSYKIEIKVYENDASEETINEGFATNIIKINQIIKKAEIALDEQTTPPTKNITYTVILYDQANDHVETDVAVEIYKPDGTLHEKKVVRSDKSTLLVLESNFEQGYWKIKANVDEIETERDFLIEEYKQVTFKLEEGSIVITNIGNVPYSGPVEMTIGSTTEVKELEFLAVGDTKTFKLSAPDGEWGITAGGENLGNAFLTGKAVSIEDIDSAGSGIIIVGFFFVILIVAAIIYVYKKRKSEILLGTRGSSSKTEQKMIERGAVTSLIDHGEKQDVSILAVDLKNLEEIQADKEAFKIIDSALWKAKESGAKIYTDGNFRVAIFAPALTKEKDNTLRAASSAQTIDRLLQMHNKHSQNKIDYGIAIHHGNLIVESKDNNLRFMSTTNIIGKTKRIASHANSEIFVTEEFHGKTLGKIKKTKLKDKKLWKLNRVIDRSKHADYIQNLSHRISSSKK